MNRLKSNFQSEYCVYLATFVTGIVLSDMPTVETMTNIMEMRETMWAAPDVSGCSIRSQMHFWYLNNSFHW